MDSLDLPADKLEKLRQYLEVVAIDDMDMAICTLESLNWNVERAIEAFLVPDHDEPEIIAEVPAATSRNPDPTLAQPPFRHPSFERNTNASSERGRRRLPEEDVGNQVKKLRIDDDVVQIDNNSTSQRVTRSSARNMSYEPVIPSASSSRNFIAPMGPQAGNRTVAAAQRVFNNAPSEDDDDMVVGYEDDEEDYRDVQVEVRTSRRNGGSVPLVPENCGDVSEALRNFVTVFESRFCNNFATSAFMPHFSTETLSNATKEAFDRPISSERRPLALYIHHEKSIASNIFASQVLCTESISNLLRHQYVFWPWDITADSNLIKLLGWLQELNMGEVRNLIQRIALRTEAFPMILIIVRHKSSFKLVETCRGIETVDQVIQKLMMGVEEYEGIRSTEVNERKEREEREAIRNQQEAEYQASLAADRSRMEAKQREIEEQRLEEERRLKAEEDEALRRQTIASMLPDEPAPTDTDIVHVKFRLPEGAQDMRRFRKSEHIQVLVNFLSSKGFNPELFKFFNSDFPKKEITGHFDLSKSFEDVKWPIREQVFVEEI